MVTFSSTSIALKWNAFFISGTWSSFEEYTPNYLKQLGFSSTQIGFTDLFGIQILFMPLFGFVGDRFRARKLVLVILSVTLILLSLAPLLPLAFPSLENCRKPSNYHLENRSEMNRNQTCCSKNDSLDISQTKSLIKEHLNLSNFNRTSSALKQTGILPWSSPLVIYMIFVRGLYGGLLLRSVFSSWNVAVMTYVNKEQKANYGSYKCWGQIGAALSLFAVGIMASHITLKVCGTIGYGYFVVYPLSAIAMTLSLIAVPSMKYEYLHHRVITWTEVKKVFFDMHYVIMLFIGVYSGWCVSFQANWEFWYIEEISGTPTVMAFAGFIRRPLVAAWFRLSVNVIEKLEDLQSIALGLFTFAVSQLALAFTEIPWLIVVIDFFQSGAFALTYSALIVHFSKCGSKASSAVILGSAEMAFGFGLEFGATCTGLLFSALGTKITMLAYFTTTAMILISFLMYISCNKRIGDYEHVRDSGSEDDN